ncbi:MAG: type II secretion system F family protein [Ornithinimicrobium sp.]
MPTYVMAAVGAISVSVGLLSMAIFAGPDHGRQRTVSNLSRGLVGPPNATGATTATGGGASPLMLRLVPGGSVQRLERLIARAGRPPAWPMERLLLAKLMLPAVAAVAGFFYLRTAPGTSFLLMTAIVVVVTFFLPELLLHSRGQERSKQIGLELADTLDQMTIAVEAGLGFDQALDRAGRNGKGPLSEELVRTLQDISVGRSRRDAYGDLANRTGAPDLRRFIRAVVQADAYGVSVAETLRTQAAEMRIKRRQRAEEKAMQIPVKVVFPLMLCILPVLFIVLLGPAVMDMIAAFSS